MASRSPDAIAAWLDATLHRFDGPAQFLGTEPNAMRRGWDHTDVRWLLAASWDYSQAAGNMAIPALYDAVHKAGHWAMADRWYLPATQRDMDLLEKGRMPVFGIESRRAAADFDVVGTSISYPVLFMNFCKHLMMSGIPLRWADRADRAGDYPMVIVGGQAWASPEFMAPVADCVWLGEAEEEPGNPGITAVCERIREFKRMQAWTANRNACYLKLAREFNFLYFPRFTVVTYHYEDRGLPEPTKMVGGFLPLVPDLPAHFRARRVGNLDNASLMTSAPVLFSDPGMGLGDMEVMRGCSSWCSFCRLSWVTKPPRQESVERSVERAALWRRNMGSADISLVAPNPPSHTRKRALIGALLEQVTGSVNASSMRIDDYLSGDFSLLLSLAGTDSITLGLEGNSQLTRDLAGKGTSDDDVAEAVRRAIRAGIRKIKLYFITNWPGETRTDVMKVVELGKRLADIRDGFGEAAKGVQIIFSWTPLLIEAQTPLQWFAVTPPDYALSEAFDALMANHRIWVKLGSKAQPAKMAFFQTCQRASRDVGEALVDVIESYGVASWGGFPQDMPQRLDAALVAHGFANGMDDIFGERFEEDLFGWEMIDTGVKRSLLWRAYQDMVEFLEGTDAETYDDQVPEGYHGNEWVPRCDQQCSGASCGVCTKEDLLLRKSVLQAADRDLAAEPVRPLDQSSVMQLVRMRVSRPPEHRFVARESMAAIVRRAAYRAAVQLPQFPPVAVQSVRFASAATGYRDRSAGVDYVEFGLTREAEHIEVGAFLLKMAVPLNSYLRWGGTYLVLPPSGRIPARASSLWDLEVADSPGVLEGWLRRWEEASYVRVLLRADSFYAGATAQEANAKDHVADFWAVRDGHRVLLRMLLNGRIGPYQAYAALAGKASWIEAARYTAMRREFFYGGAQPCEGCGFQVPASLMDVPWTERFCPRCDDEAEGRIIASLASGVLQATVLHTWGEPCGYSRTCRQRRRRRDLGRRRLLAHPAAVSAGACLRCSLRSRRASRARSAGRWLSPSRTGT